MRTSRILLLVVGIVTLVGCTSSLQVKSDRVKDAEGVPFYLLEHNFVVNELGLTAEGASAPVKGQKVDFVTRVDPTRQFRILNRSGGITDTEFSVARDSQGGLTAVTGGVTDRTFETIQALASTAKTAAVLAAKDGGVEEKLKNDQEFMKLKQLERALLDDLKSAGESKPDPGNAAARAERVEKIQKALNAVRTRLQEIKVAAEPKVGTVKSYSRLAPVDVPTCRPSDGDAVERLAKDSKVAGPDEVLVVIVPIDLRPC